MPFDQSLADRIRKSLARRKKVESKKMFGGLAFLLKGNLLVGVMNESLVVRVGPDEYEYALLEPHVKVFDFTGKPLKGWVVVHAAGLTDEEHLSGWLQRALKFVGKLPAK